MQTLRDYLVTEVDRLTASARTLVSDHPTDEEVAGAKALLDQVAALRSQIQKMDETERAAQFARYQLDAL